MAKLPRIFQKIFGSLSVNNGQFGSARAGTKVTSLDPSILMQLAAYTTGWSAATVAGEKLPTLEEMQALSYIETYQLAYLMQEGIAEYDAQTTYFQNSVVKKTGTFELYGSIADDNTGNALTDPTKWQLLCDLTEVSNAILPEEAVASAATTPIGATTSVNVQVTGTVTITSLGVIAAGIYRKVRFAGALTLTNSGNIIIPGGANIITAANDEMEALSLGGGVWIVRYYSKASGDANGIISAAHGGTAQNSWAAGDLLFASAANTLAKRAIGANGQYLMVSGGLPVWGDGRPRIGAVSAPAAPAFNANTQWTGGDGFLTIIISTTGTGTMLTRFNAFCDATVTPSVPVSAGYMYGHASANNANGESIALMFPIRNNDYYVVTQTNIAGAMVATMVMAFRPLTNA